MTVVTESDIKELKDLINNRFEALEKGQNELKGEITEIKKEISDLRVSIGKVEGILQSQQPFVQKIPDLAEKVGELKNWRQIVIIAITAIISSRVTWLIRGENLKP